MDGLSDLIEGAAYSQLGDRKASTRCYRNCLKRRLPSKDSLDQHVSAFALYELGSELCSGSVSDFFSMDTERLEDEIQAGCICDCCRA